MMKNTQYFCFTNLRTDLDLPSIFRTYHANAIKFLKLLLQCTATYLQHKQLGLLERHNIYKTFC